MDASARRRRRCPGGKPRHRPRRLVRGARRRPRRTGCSRSPCGSLGDPQRRRGGGPGRARPCLSGDRGLRRGADPRAAARGRGWRRSSSTSAATERASAGSDRRAGRSSPAPSRAVDPLAPARRTRTPGPTLLLALPPAQRTAVVLRHVDGLSYAEMAEALGRPEGTLKAQVHRGLATLRSVRRRRAARARGDDRMNRPRPIDHRRDRGRPRHARRAGPAEPRPRALVAVGLADDYAIIDSPVGPLRVAWNGRGVSAVGECRRRSRRSRSGSWLEPAAGPTRQDALPAGLARAIERRLAGDRRARIELDLRGSSEFEQAVWLKALEIPRGEVRPYGWVAARDRAAEGGPSGRDGARPQPGPADRAVPSGRAERRDDRPVLARRPGRTSGRSSPPRASIPTRWRASPGPGSGIIGSDTTQIVLPADVPQREADHARASACRSARAAASEAAGYRACRECRPASGRRRRRLSTAGTPAAGRRRLLHCPDVGPSDYANEHRAPRRGRA